MPSHCWKVLVLDHDPVVARIHKRWVDGESGFQAIATAESAAQALALARGHHPDLVVVDIKLHAMSGLQVLDQLRRVHRDTDAIVTTASRDATTVHDALHAGAIDYLLKPFTRERFQQALVTFSIRRRSLARGELSQADIDAVLGVDQMRRLLPKGLSAPTLERVRRALAEKHGLCSAADIAREAGISPVVARRYLEHLLAIGYATLDLRYGSRGRPRNLYRATVG